jgi:hypothetical protein
VLRKCLENQSAAADPVGIGRGSGTKRRIHTAPQAEQAIMIDPTTPQPARKIPRVSFAQNSEEHAAGRLGFSGLKLFPGSEGFFILFSKLGAESLRARLSAALNVFRQADHQGRAVASWDLQALGYVQVLDDPIVEDLAPGADAATLSQRGAA